MRAGEEEGVAIFVGTGSRESGSDEGTVRLFVFVDCFVSREKRKGYQSVVIVVVV